MKIKKFIADHKVEIGAALFTATTIVVANALLNKSHELALRNVLDGHEVTVRLDTAEVAKDILSEMKDLTK